MRNYWSKKSKEKKKKAFTLVEILIVIAVIGILFVALVPRIDFAGDKARETEVKNDFRSFELAAEQYLREEAGFWDIYSTVDLCADGSMNRYLDDEMSFEESGVCHKEDPWNNAYTVQAIKEDGDNPNNGAIIFISCGQDGKISTTKDNYALGVVFYNGQIITATAGFSKNINSNLYIPERSHAVFEVDEEGDICISYDRS